MLAEPRSLQISVGETPQRTAVVQIIEVGELEIHETICIFSAGFESRSPLP